MNEPDLITVSSDTIRSQFSAAMSDMYRQEVPAYGTLLQIVEKVNAETLAGDSTLKTELESTDNLERLSVERHGAIRLGTADELSMMRRVFAIMGMFPVGYYDLASAGIPVHSTAFRPLSHAALTNNPFRVFTSLLRLELIEDDDLRDHAERILSDRQIFTKRAVELVGIAESQQGLIASQAEQFVDEVLNTFRWYSCASVSLMTYQNMHDAHQLVADIVSFRGPHINHLTPRTLDIDRVQAAMPDYGIEPKAVIEGPPKRKCPVLLRQTSFKALNETVYFPSHIGDESGTHTARFGEIEQRGVALTRKGRELYDRLLDNVRAEIAPAADGSNAAEYLKVLSDGFAELPDDWRALLDQGLAYFRFSLTQAGSEVDNAELVDFTVAGLLDQGLIQFSPITYEDFLPVSAAGIFQSNLGDNAALEIESLSSQQQFEVALGVEVVDEFSWYEKIQRDSLQVCFDELGVVVK